MGKTQEIFFELAVNFFEAKEYEQSVIYFIKAYKLGYRREKIIDILYSCFINPNEDEFRANYKENCVEMTQFPYDNLILDFIPVSDEKYYIFDREKKEFKGSFELEEGIIGGKEVEFHSLLCTDFWDIREITPIIMEREWETVYILLEGIEERFLSFFKLKKFKEKYLENAVLFKNNEYMHLFFEMHDEFYLPKEIVSKEPEKYIKIVEQLHQKRLYCLEKKRENIFLSICIPSYNRGNIALENVLHILKCPYDSEIEVIVSNNGSMKGREEYRKIGELLDVRVQYYEFEQNQGYATNVLKTLSLAKGRFAIITSDEDMIMLEQLQEYLSCLKANRMMGVFWEKVIGPNSYLGDKNELYQAGFGAIRKAISLNYITGITYNMDLLRKVGAFRIVAQMRGNEFLEAYVHMILAAVVGKVGGAFFVNLLLWDGREQKGIDYRDEQGLKNYMLPQNRIKQLKSLLQFLYEQLNMEKGEFKSIFLEQIEKFYGMLAMAYMSFEDYQRIYTWEEICVYFFREVEKYVDFFPFRLNEEEKKILSTQLQSMFLGYLEMEKMLMGIMPGEVQKKKIIHQIIRMELGGCEQEVLDFQIKNKICLNLSINLEEVINKGKYVVEERDLRKALSEGKLIQYIYEECWNQKKNTLINMKSWDT